MAVQCERGGELAIPHIEVVAADDAWCAALAPEGNVKQRNYRLLAGGVRAYTPTGDVHTSPAKRKLVPRYESATELAPPRERLLSLLRPGDELLSAVVRPAARRAASPLPEDSRRYLQRALLSPSPPLWSEPSSRAGSPRPRMDARDGARSLADELRDAGECALRGRTPPPAPVPEPAPVREEGSLVAAGARLDALLREARALHAELAAAHRDLQAQSARACRCSEAARALVAESHSLRYLDDLVALLRGDVTAATMARAWPFALDRRQPDRNYIV